MDMADITILCKLAPRMEKNDRSEQLQSEIVLGENEIVCSLTNRVVKTTEKELTLQSMINMMAEEYDFAPSDMERDFKVKYEDENEGKSKTQKVDLAIFEEGQSHDVENLIRFIIVAKDSKVKAEDKKNGVVASLEGILSCTNCDFGCWTNGEDLQYQYSYEDNYGQVTIDSISDFPANGQTLEDLEAQGERAVPRKPANESLIKTFKRCHDYIYGNEGMKKTAFWELLNLIFCKLYDEKRRFSDAKEGISYRRRFWVGVKEQNTEEGCHTVAERIKSLFNDLKESHIFKDVFDGNEQIMLSDRGLAYVAGELAKYSFLDATVDVKGTAYETIVSNTLKQEAGQFFTPRNIIKCMVEMNYILIWMMFAVKPSRTHLRWTSWLETMPRR
jgi:type I restriction enzyme M protein